MAEPAKPGAAPLASWLRRQGSLGGRTVAVLALIALLLAAADKSRLSLDGSADHRFTLSPSLVAILREQRSSVELVTVWGDELAGLTEPCAEVLKAMAGENPHALSYRHIDPVLHRVALDDFTKRYHEDGQPAIYVVTGTGEAPRAFKIPVNQLTRQLLQREVGGALLSLRDTHPPTAALLLGHGELRPGGGEQDGDDRLVRSLELGGFTVESVELARGGRLEAGALLVVAGAAFPLGVGDCRAVEQHLADGGSALILGDDRMPGDLAAVLRRRGVLWGRPLTAPPPVDWAAYLAAAEAGAPMVIASRDHNFSAGAAFPYHNLVLGGTELVNPRHLASAQVALGGQSLLSPYSVLVQVLDPRLVGEQAAKPLIAAYAALGTPPFSAEPLLQTARQDTWLKARAEPFTEPERLGPPLPLAWAINYAAAKESVREDQGARLVLWGSRQAASDAMLKLDSFANQTLLVDLAKWAARREPASGIPEAESAAFRVDCSDRGLSWLTALLIAIIPCSCIGGAILSWWERR
jgi:hypothetical protein